MFILKKNILLSSMPKSLMAFNFLVAMILTFTAKTPPRLVMYTGTKWCPFSHIPLGRRKFHWESFFARNGRGDVCLITKILIFSSLGLTYVQPTCHNKLQFLHPPLTLTTSLSNAISRVALGVWSSVKGWTSVKFWIRYSNFDSVMPVIYLYPYERKIGSKSYRNTKLNIYFKRWQKHN